MDQTIDTAAVDYGPEEAANFVDFARVWPAGRRTFSLHGPELGRKSR